MRNIVKYNQHRVDYPGYIGSWLEKNNEICVLLNITNIKESNEVTENYILCDILGSFKLQFFFILTHYFTFFSYPYIL